MSVNNNIFGGSFSGAGLLNAVLATWPGSTNVTTVGTIVTGTWEADTITIAQGGTNNTTAYTGGSIIYSDGTKLTQDNANLFFDSSNKRLGVGTNAPTAALHVVNPTSSSSASFIIEDSDSPDATQFVVDASGRVGIGMTPTHPLDVSGHMRCSDTCYAQTADITNAVISETLTTKGFINTRVVKSDESYVIIATDGMYITTGSTTLTAARTFTLPLASSCTGRRFIITDEGAINGSNILTIDTTSPDTIEGASSILISSAFGSHELSSTGTGWVRLGKQLQNVASQSIIGRNTSGTGNVEVLDASTTKSILALSNVENVAISSWAGSTNVTTLGTIATGTWAASTIPIARGGTNNTTAYTAGSILFADGTKVNEANSELFWDNGNSRLGVGTTGPSAKVHIINASGVDSFRVDDAVSDNSVMRIDNNGNMILRQADGLAFQKMIQLATPASQSGLNMSLQANGEGIITGYDVYTSQENIGFRFAAGTNTGEFPNYLKQSLGIGIDGPHASAMLDISSTNRGLLLPRQTSAQVTTLATIAAEGIVVHDTNLKNPKYFDGTSMVELSTPPRIPPYQNTAAFTAPQYRGMVSYLRMMQGMSPRAVTGKNINHGFTLSTTEGETTTHHFSTLAYKGAVFAPTQNRIYFVPHGQYNQPKWHYYNCETGLFVEYTHGQTLNGGYQGGAYCPIQNRIYFSPLDQGKNSFEPVWHYVDCSSSKVDPPVIGTYTITGFTTANLDTMFLGAVYSPTQKRIYFIPCRYSTQSTWIYINCETGIATTYVHGISGLIALAYKGGVYSPKQNRIYFVPHDWLPSNGATSWHYIDCNSSSTDPPTFGSYSTGNSLGIGGIYNGGTYSPTENRIYFVPHGQAYVSTWHYLDCNTGLIVEYIHGMGSMGGGAYIGGVYSPTLNRIYFIPASQSSQANWHYVDCDTSTIVAYSPSAIGFTGIVGSGSAYTSGAYSPYDNRIVFAPLGQSRQTSWHVLDEQNILGQTVPIDRMFCASSMFNPY